MAVEQQYHRILAILCTIPTGYCIWKILKRFSDLPEQDYKQTVMEPTVVHRTEWHPARLFQSDQAGPQDQNDFALVVLNQPLEHSSSLNRLWNNSSFHVAADGGANQLRDSALQNKNSLNTIIGDLDSLSDETRKYFRATCPGLEIIHDPDQYSTDFTKAVKYIRKRKPAADIVSLGGLGGRVDQGISQLHHLYMFQTSSTYSEGKMYLVSGESLTFLLKAGKHFIYVRERTRKRGRPEQDDGEPNRDVFDKYVGILPVKEPSVITTKGLEWDVEDWPTEFGTQMSTSNHVLPETEVVEVQTTKDVLFTIALLR